MIAWTRYLVRRLQVELYSQLSQPWKSAGGYAWKWLSNEPEVLQFIPSANCATEVDLDWGELLPVKTLGVLWCPMEDVFKFQVNQPPEKHEHSKHSFLNKMAALFDPLGLLSPYTVRATVLYYCVMALRSSVHFSRWHTPFEFIFGMEEGYKYFWMWWSDQRQWHELLWICQWPSRYIRNCIIKWGRVCKVAQHWQKDVCDKCLRPMVFQGGERAPGDAPW